MSDDGRDGAGGDRTLRIAGIAIVLAVVAGVGVLVIAGANAPSGGSNVPEADFSVSRVNGTYVRVVHAGGESISGTYLVVTVDSKIRHPSWSGNGTLISEGDRALLRVQEGQVVRIWWEGPPGSRSLLDSTRVG